jgi:hypothetical protein
LRADGNAPGGRVLIHGTATPHRLRTAGYGYSVSLHAGATR